MIFEFRFLNFDLWDGCADRLLIQEASQTHQSEISIQKSKIDLELK